MRSFSLGCLVLLAGCGAGLLRDDPPPSVADGCATPQGCRALERRAALALHDCDAADDAPHACERAAIDLAEIRRRLEAFAAAPFAAPGRPAGDEAPLAPDEEPRAKPPAPVDRASVFEDTTGRCIARNQPALCGALRTEEGRVACRSTCADRVRHTADRLVEQAVESCASRLVERGGEEAPRCRFDPGDSVTRTWTPDERLEECAAECEKLGREQIRRAQLRVKCCDGSRSPSCTYAAMRSGCCLHHGGVCGE